jgi:hypothetical protein
MFLDARKRANGQYSELLPMGGARGPHKRLCVCFGRVSQYFCRQGSLQRRPQDSARLVQPGRSYFFVILGGGLWNGEEHLF